MPSTIRLRITSAVASKTVARRNTPFGSGTYPVTTFGVNIEKKFVVSSVLCKPPESNSMLELIREARRCGPLNYDFDERRDKAHLGVRHDCDLSGVSAGDVGAHRATDAIQLIGGSWLVAGIEWHPIRYA